jgi:Protein of unknown function (DUF1592)/Protein of unknown function (DUF1588)/Protein of unknown function (DUF1587)/Protein of unknown function (DUF1585)/Protein of unknown function (DUF1595)/Planctomycete cytochrome C
MNTYTYVLIRTVIFTLMLSAMSTASEAIRTFVKAHCYNCHDSSTSEAGLDLEKQEFALSEKELAHAWELVYDLVSSEEMPPKEIPLTPEARAKFLAELGKELRSASLVRQAKEGRSSVRRLTRLEYETTVNDLLHIYTDLSSFFPDDSVTHGFDKVGEGLSLSGAHFAAYQAAAEKALNAAIERYPVITSSHDGDKLYKGKEKEFRNWGCWVEGSVFALPSGLFYPGITLLTPRAEHGGRYRVTITAQGRNNSNRPLPVALGILDWPRARPNAPETSLWVDMPEDHPRTASAEMMLDHRQHVNLHGPSLSSGTKVLDLFKKGERWTGHVLLLHNLKFEGPLKPDGTIDHWPGESYRGLFGDLAGQPLSKITSVPAEKGKPDPWFPISAAPKEDAERLLRQFLPKAFRREVPEELVKSYVAEAHAALDRGLPFYRAMLDSYKSILCSPHFLLLEEKPGRLDGPALANRLSYFLWNSAPDKALHDAVAKGKLNTREGRAEQVERMLNDPRAERFERSFVDQWLDLKNLGATSPDGVLYSEITPSMFIAAEQETRRFFHDLLAEDRSVLESIQSDWTYANELLSSLYDLPDIAGYEMRKISLPPQSPRGGVLTQASVLKVTADGAKTSPIIRGKWVNERILGVTLRPPPDNIPKIEPDIRGATTIREQLAKHRNTPACMSCHTVIDPPGFALENFDVIGGWRDFYRMPSHTGKVIKLTRFNGRQVHRGPAVESGYCMPDGRTFADITAYKRMLLEDKERIVSTFTKKLLTYASGAPVQFADRDDIAAIVTETRVKNFGLRSLIHAIVESRPFLHK